MQRLSLHIRRNLHQRTLRQRTCRTLMRRYGESMAASGSHVEAITCPALPFEAWSATCDTLHAHTQVLGKLAAALAPPEPQLQHAALRLTVRGWETLPLPAPDASGALAVALDLRTHQVVAEHSDGRAERVALTPNRSVADVTRE